MKKVVLAVFVLFLVAGVAAAQDVPKVEVFGGYSLLKLGGSDINSFTDEWENEAELEGLNPSSSKLFTKGFDASIAFNINGFIGIEANFLYNRGDLLKASGTYEGYLYDVKMEATDYAFMVGPRFTYRKNDKVTPFAHVLLGVNHFKLDPSFTIEGEDYSDELSDYKLSDTGIGMAVGGGIDINVNEVFGIRLIQADYFMARHEDFTQSNLNLASGVVFRF